MVIIGTELEGTSFYITNITEKKVLTPVESQKKVPRKKRKILKVQQNPKLKDRVKAI